MLMKYSSQQIKKEALNLVIGYKVKNLLFLLIFCLNIRLIFWVAIFFLSITFSIKNCLNHLVPEETSYAFLPLMGIIETLSNLIRPFTLAIRIRANIIAGHLLLVLVRGFLTKVRIIGFPVLYFGTTILILLETIVIAIQAYIFTILIS